MLLQVSLSSASVPGYTEIDRPKEEQQTLQALALLCKSPSNLTSLVFPC